jgi:type IV secretion system protein VirB5
MRHTIIALSLSVLTVGTAIAAIPVYDPIANATLAYEKAENLIRWKNQLESWRKQYKQMEDAYKAVTGIRKAADLLNIPEIRRRIPQQYDQLVNLADRIQNGQISTPDAQTKAIRDAIAIIKSADLKSKVAEDAVNALRTTVAQDVATWDAAWKESSKRIEQIQYLMDKIKDPAYANDAKAIADLQARLASEQQFLTLENTRLQIMKNIQESRQRMRLQQADERNKAAGGANLKIQIEDPWAK